MISLLRECPSGDSFKMGIPGWVILTISIYITPMTPITSIGSINDERGMIVYVYIYGRKLPYQLLLAGFRTNHQPYEFFISLQSQVLLI